MLDRNEYLLFCEIRNLLAMLVRATCLNTVTMIDMDSRNELFKKAETYIDENYMEE